MEFLNPEPFVVPAWSCGGGYSFPRGADSLEQGKSQRNQGSHSEGWRRTQKLLPEVAGLMKMGGMEQSLLLTAKLGWEEDK